MVVLARLYRRLPRPLVYRAAALYAAVARALTPRRTRRRRRWLAAYAARVGWPVERLDRMMRVTYLCITLDDLLWLAPRWPEHPQPIVEGDEHLRRAFAGGRGAIVAFDHVGFYRILNAHLIAQGYRTMFVAPGRRSHPRLPLPQRAAWALRRRLKRPGSRQRGRAHDAVETLRRGDVVVIAADGAGGTQMDVPFLGATMPRGTAPARLALTSGAAIVPAVVIPEAGARYRLRFHEPIIPDPGLPRAEAIAQAVASVAVIVERACREAPWIARRKIITACAGRALSQIR